VGLSYNPVESSIVRYIWIGLIYVYMTEFYKLKMASTAMYYMKTTAKNKKTEQEEEISLKSTVDESHGYVSNAITNGEDGNEFKSEIKNASEIEEDNVPEEVLGKFEERIKKFENHYMSITIRPESEE